MSHAHVRGEASIWRDNLNPVSHAHVRGEAFGEGCCTEGHVAQRPVEGHITQRPVDDFMLIKFESQLLTQASLEAQRELRQHTHLKPPPGPGPAANLTVGPRQPGAERGVKEDGGAEAKVEAHDALRADLPAGDPNSSASAPLAEPPLPPVRGLLLLPMTPSLNIARLRWHSTQFAMQQMHLEVRANQHRVCTHVWEGLRCGQGLRCAPLNSSFHTPCRR